MQAVTNNKLGLPLNTNTKVKYEAIREEIGNDHNEDHDNKLGINSVKRWWDKREEFQQTGSLEPAKRTGRCKHGSLQIKSSNLVTFLYAQILVLVHIKTTSYSVAIILDI